MTVLELRQYTMVPERRADFVDLFDREFVETQEAVGMEIVGQFTDLDRPDRYVWIRRFPDMETRASSLDAFYSGPVWAEHSAAANPMMTEWHDVLLLKPAGEGRDLAVSAADRPPPGRKGAEGGPLAILLWEVVPDNAANFAGSVARAFPDARAVYLTDRSANTYPRLPIREDASVVVAIFDRALPADVATVNGRTPSQVLRLAPTTRSALRGA
ncbi:MAG: NIPSNAP family protein [Mesorhizobium sp.]|jgi:hypothetical protein|nr:NIPSNAP family protein [Mesorhizobium sp.]